MSIDANKLIKTKRGSILDIRGDLKLDGIQLLATAGQLNTLTEGFDAESSQPEQGDATELHHHDGRYYTEAELAHTEQGKEGSRKIGTRALNFTNFAPQRDDVEAVLQAIDTAFSSTSPVSATFLTLSSNSTLTGERILTAGTGISLTDAGANSTATILLADSGVTAASYGSTSAIPVITVDAKGRITSASTAALSVAFTAAGTSGSNQTISNGDTLTIAAGTGITTTGSATDTITIASTLGTSIAASEVDADTLDFSEFQDALDLDASTDIAVDGSEVFSITNTGTGNSFLVNDVSSDTTPFVIDASGNVGVGTSSPGGKLAVIGTADDEQLIVKANSTQTANLQEWQNSSGLRQVYVASDGSLNVGSSDGIQGTLNVRATNGSAFSITMPSGFGPTISTYSVISWENANTSSWVNDGTTTLFAQGSTQRWQASTTSAAAVPWTVVGASSQTANLQEWQNSSNTVLAAISSEGLLAIGQDSTPDASLEVINDGSGDSFLVADSADGDTTPFVITSAGNVGAGDASPDYLLELSSAVASDSSFALSDGDVAHGLTSLGQTDAYFLARPISSTAGGTKLEAFSDTDAAALQIYGYIGSTDPTDTTPAIKLIGAKKNTTGVQDLGDAETVFSVANNDNTAAINVVGNGTIGIGTASPSVYGIFTIEQSTNYSLATHFILNNSSGVTKAYMGLESGADLVLNGLGANDFFIRTVSQAIGFSTNNGGSSNLYISSDGLVSIGYDSGSTPDASLEVINDGVGDSFLVADSADGDTTPFVIDSTGKVGIGDSAPTYAMDLAGGSGTTSSLRLGSDATNTGLYFSIFDANSAMLTAGASWDSSVSTARATTASGIYLHDNSIIFYTNSALTSGNTFTQSRRASFDNEGLTIGSSSPTGYRLEVINASGTSMGAIAYFSNNNNVNTNGGVVINTVSTDAAVKILNLTGGSSSKFTFYGDGDAVTVGQLDAGTSGDGLVTKVNAGACDDTVFSSDTNGLICIDSTNGRIYYRYSGAWHYSA